MCSPCCLYACEFRLLTFETIFTKLDMYIKTPEPISTTCTVNPPHHFVYLYLLGNGSVKIVTAATNTENNRNIVGTVFYKDHIVSRKVGD